MESNGNTESIGGFLRIYQPIPFKEFKDVQSTRTLADCEGRYQAIVKNYGDIKDKTLIELCCANGYFGFRFLQDGGKSVIGVEQDKEVVAFVNDLAVKEGMEFLCVNKIFEIHALTDIGIYLDTHFHDGTNGYVEFMRSAVRVLYTSSCRDNDAYRCLLVSLFEKVEKIYDEVYADRVMFRCEGVK